MVRKMSKRLLISLLILGTVISLATYGVTTSIRANEDGYSNPVISRLAETFDLKEDEVEAVFDAVHEERWEQMKAAREERLNDAVEDGVINEVQKNALLAKWEEMQQKHEQEREEIQKWFEDQGIDPTELAPYGGFGHPAGFGKMGMGMMH